MSVGRARSRNDILKPDESMISCHMPHAAAAAAAAWLDKEPIRALAHRARTVAVNREGGRAKNVHIGHWLV